jgi:hypothetical protein
VVGGKIRQPVMARSEWQFFDQNYGIYTADSGIELTRQFTQLYPQDDPANAILAVRILRLAD